MATSKVDLAGSRRVDAGGGGSARISARRRRRFLAARRARAPWRASPCESPPWSGAELVRLLGSFDWAHAIAFARQTATLPAAGGSAHAPSGGAVKVKVRTDSGRWRAHAHTGSSVAVAVEEAVARALVVGEGGHAREHADQGVVHRPLRLRGRSARARRVAQRTLPKPRTSHPDMGPAPAQGQQQRRREAAGLFPLG